MVIGNFFEKQSVSTATKFDGVILCGRSTDGLPSKYRPVKIWLTVLPSTVHTTNLPQKTQFNQTGDLEDPSVVALSEGS